MELRVRHMDYGTVDSMKWLAYMDRLVGVVDLELTDEGRMHEKLMVRAVD